MATAKKRTLSFDLIMYLSEKSQEENAIVNSIHCCAASAKGTWSALSLSSKINL